MQTTKFIDFVLILFFSPQFGKNPLTAIEEYVRIHAAFPEADLTTTNGRDVSYLSGNYFPSFTPSHSDEDPDDGNTNDTIPTLIDQNEESGSVYEGSQTQKELEDYEW